MKRFLDFLIAFKEYVALTIFVAVSLTMIAISRNSEVEPLRAFATGIVGAIQSTYAWIPNPVTMARENKELQQHAVELASEVGKLRRSEAENKELRRLLGIAPHPDWKLIPASVVGKTTSFQRNMLTLDLGAKDSIFPGMAVITDGGLVGRVYSTSTNFSLVQMLFNGDLRIASKIARTRVEGIIAWDGGPTLVMRNVPKALDVQIGDLVVSSEYSSFFPSDVPIGTVIRIQPEPNSLFRRVTVDPAVNLFRVEHVYVILKDAAKERERLQLEASAKSPVSTTPKTNPSTQSSKAPQSSNNGSTQQKQIPPKIKPKTPAKP